MLKWGEFTPSPSGSMVTGARWKVERPYMANGVAFGTYQGSWYGRVVQADDEKGDNLHMGTLYFARGEVLG